MAKSSNGNGNGNGRAKRNGNGNGNGKRAGASTRGRSGPRTIPVRPGRADESQPSKGTLIIIGGHEDKEHERIILRAVADRVGSGKLVLVTVASSVPDELWKDYHKVFGELGVKRMEQLHVDSRGEAKLPEKFKILDGATVVFITGGDQLKLTSQLGDSPIYEGIHEIYQRGGTIAGTSAGASVMCETMLVTGNGSESHRIGSALHMAPGFGLIPGVIIDQHFAERGRIGRLTAAVAQNPRILGVGIDENTAIICDASHCFTVLGKGAVYVLDGRALSYTNLSDEDRDRTLSAFDVRLHLLSMGDEFDIEERRPASHPAEAVERALVSAD